MDIYSVGVNSETYTDTLYMARPMNHTEVKGPRRLRVQHKIFRSSRKQDVHPIYPDS
ncbi:hypothetical protein M404DRAFT_994906 [Pisolithus tinctorius Marx 270]|uniref:Uncharacterized protein n=1 Tax=Pisolithus tinctorius Marx 270 TaxID=870435 RepID=A0A0C3KNP7_PISTI|nr:hypothetical protein M404DRAFT_994906 [Pisolithus tinctorius Marx 270]